MKLPDQVRQILNRLNRSGYEAYAVGGCVRDSLLGRRAGDWDITTSASPNQVKALFSRTVDTGIAHGTVTVMLDGNGFEVTTYRIDGEYRDGRHPESVSFTASLEEDLKRRDFTINAMAYHPDTGIVDLFGGQEDLKQRRIRCVGEPCERFQEDALRMMRALRFRAQLDFLIEERTAQAIKELAPRLGLVSRERIQAELMKLLLSDHPECLLDLGTLKLAPYVLPAFETLPDLQRKQAAEAAKATEKKKHLRLAVLFCTECATADWRNQPPEEIQDRERADLLYRALRSLRFDNATMDQARLLVCYHRVTLRCDRYLLRRLLHCLGPVHFFELLSIHRVWANVRQRRDYEQSLGPVKELAEEILAAGECLDLKHLAVNGRDLSGKGVHGRQIGELLSAMLELVLREPEHNEKEYLLKKFSESMKGD